MKTRIIFGLTIAFAVNALAQQAFTDPETALAFAQKSRHHFGTVRYPDGKPAAGVRVEFYPGHHPWAGSYAEVETDANGRYEITEQEDGRDFMGGIVVSNCILARDVERNLAAIQEFHMTTTNVDLVLQPAITFTGSVKDLAGAPITGAEVGFGFQASNQGNLLEAQPIKVNELGHFSIPALPQGRTYSVWGINAKGYGSGYAWLEPKYTRTDRYEFPTFVLLRADRKIAGRVMDETGKPLARADVVFSGVGQPPPFPFTNTSTEWNLTFTDSEGRFHFETVCDSPLKISADYYDSTNRIFYTRNGGLGMPAQPGDTNIIIRLAAENK